MVWPFEGGLTSLPFLLFWLGVFGMVIVGCVGVAAWNQLICVYVKEWILVDVAIMFDVC